MRVRRAIVRAVVAVAVVAAVGAGAFIASPVPPDLLDYGRVQSVRVLDRDGLLLRELRSRADGKAVPIDSTELSPTVRAAFLAAEDKGFFTHLGLSPTSMARALWQNLRAGHVVAGGSTITQQLARTLVPRERTLFGKTQEALWALRLEAHASKVELLTQYLNRVPFGNSTYGIEAASELYFGKRAEHLSLAQAALLASIPRGPTAYNPYRAQSRLEARRQWVLDRLEVDGLLPPDEIAAARAEPLDLAAFDSTFVAPHFVEYVSAHLRAWGLEDAAVVQTSLDSTLQRDVEEQIHEEISRLSGRRVSSGAALVIDNATGDVLAYQGSADFFDEAIGGQNDGVQMRRQPGSALKPFVYAEAFRRGLTTSTVIPDLEIGFGSAKGTYSPKNYDRRLHGPVRAREALANSYNVPAVRVANEVGLERTLEVLRAAGFDSLTQTAEHYGLGIALGNGEVSLWEAGRAYSGLARGGVRRPLRVVLHAYRADGTALPLPLEAAPTRFADARAVALVTNVLSDNAARAKAFGLDNALRLPFPVAAKTGTSKGYSDNWTVGFTAERTVAAWAGNFDGTPMVQVSGITGAGPIFRRVMTRAMSELSPRALISEQGLERAKICPLSGHLAGPHCPAAMEELFIAGTAPRQSCEMHRTMDALLPEDLAKRCLALAAADGRLIDLGLDFYDWARDEGLSREPWLASLCLGENVTANAAPSAILHPADGDEFLMLADLPAADQTIPLRVRAAPQLGELSVLLDGRLIATLAPPYTGRVAATRGAHRLDVRTRTGAPVGEVKYTVRAE